MAIRPLKIEALLPPTSIIGVLRANKLSLAKENIVQFVSQYFQKISSSQALHVISNLITRGLVKYDDAEYEVESIESHSWDAEEKQMYYRIKWHGWPSECNTWESESSLTNCKDLLEDYQNFINGRNRKRAYPSFSEAGTAADAAERSKARLVQLLDCIDFDGLSPEQFESALADCLGKRAMESLSKSRRLPSLAKESKSSKVARVMAELKSWERAMNDMEPKARIVVENKVDLEGPPSDFTYVTQRVPGAGVSISNDPVLGCSCTDCFADRKSCLDSHYHNGGIAPYNKQGRLKDVESNSAIHECNSLCSCGPDCPFRAVQRGRRYGLSIFRTRNRGWGVRTLEQIPRGAFVIEYVGEVVTTDEAERRGLNYDREGQTYLFDLDPDGDPKFSVDAKNLGNASHFLNHSCSPNLGVRCVYTQCVDKDLPLLALFALEPIQRNAELTFDYKMTGAVGIGHAMEQGQEEEVEETQSLLDAAGQLVPDPDGGDGAADAANVAESESTRTPPDPDDAAGSTVGGGSSIGPAKIPCLCGAANCRKYLFD